MSKSLSSSRSDASKCRLEEETFTFWCEQGGLREHWYAVAFSSALVCDKPIRQVVMGIPIVLWRTKSGKIAAFVDVCPHRQAPLSAGAVDGGGLVCPYHGWRFGSDGVCNHIPVAAAGCFPRETVRLIDLQVVERSAVVWVWMGKQAPGVPPNDESDSQDGWDATRSMQQLPCDLDDLVENFMDFAHTPVVHPGTIRATGVAQERNVTVRTEKSSVCAIHDPVEEKVGPFSGLFVPSGPVKHSDSFSLPASVCVEYAFGDRAPSFIAQLHMTPVARNETLLLVTLRVRFGLMNKVIRLALPSLVRKVLGQDLEILKLQRQNLDLLAKRNRKTLQADAVDAIVRAIRDNRRDPNRPAPKPGLRKIVVRV